MLFHLTEQGEILPADNELRGTLLELQLQPAAAIADHAFDGGHVDDGRTVDLPEHGRVEFVGELLDGLADHRFAALLDDQRVLLVGLEVADVIDHDHAHAVVARRLDPIMRLFVLSNALAPPRGT